MVRGLRQHPMANVCFKYFIRILNCFADPHNAYEFQDCDLLTLFHVYVDEWTERDYRRISRFRLASLKYVKLKVR